MKAEVYKACTDTAKIGATYDIRQGIDDVLMCKMATEAICKFNK